MQTPYKDKVKIAPNAIPLDKNVKSKSNKVTKLAGMQTALEEDQSRNHSISNIWDWAYN
jgi:hypothetical protein